MRSNEKNLDLREFLESLAAEQPGDLLHIPEPVGLDFDVTAVAMELERQGRAPVIRFDKVGDSPFPVVTNLFGDRGRYARALGVAEADLIETWAGLGEKTIEPVIRETGPVLDVVRTGNDVDLASLPILNHFAEDGGRYVTNGIVVAKDPDTGVRNASYHRLQVMGKTRFGTSLHSRRHLWNYAQRAAERDEPIPVSVVIGHHPLFAFGSGLWKGPIDADEYAVAGGFMGQALELVAGVTVPVEAPAHAEFVLEGHIVPGEQADEGPFA